MRSAPPGTIDFQLDVLNDIVIAKPRWTLDSPVEVMRWYQMHAGFLSKRFGERKDVIAFGDGFDVSAATATLWGQYRARLHESYVRVWVGVNSSPRVVLNTNTSAARHSIAAFERSSLDDAVAAVLAARQGIDVPSVLRSGAHAAVVAPPRSREG